jgi:hypothetical protein
MSGRYAKSEKCPAGRQPRWETLSIDDVGGSEAAGTVRFGPDGAEYEIDLNAGHAQESLPAHPWCTQRQRR